MASADKNNTMPPMPALPPLVEIDNQKYRDGVLHFCFDQNWSPAIATTSADTPPLYCINVGRLDEPSAMSLLTAPPNIATASAASRRRDRDASGLSDEDEPSPKKALPNFNLQKSEEDSIDCTWQQFRWMGSRGWKGEA